VVAALSFGFWVSLLSGGHGWNYEMTLWRPGLRKAFPEYRGTRARLHNKLNTVRLFRNRIAHHEPVHHRHLAADYESVLTIAGWLSPAYARWIRRQDQIVEVIARRP